MANVLLAHGLWRTPICMLSLGRRLKAEGHVARQFAYVSVAEPHERIVTRLAAQLSALAATGPYAVIGYSLGGVLLRAALARVSGPQPAHFVMLGTPNRVPLLARRLSTFAAFHLTMGESGSNLSREQFYAALPRPRCPYTIIAGTRGPVGRLSPFLDEPNDGIVAVEETRIADDDVPVLLPVNHAFLPSARIVQQLVVDVLARAFASAPVAAVATARPA